MNDSPTEHSHQERQERQSFGPMAAIIIVVIVLLVGGIYFLIQEKMKPQQTPTDEQVNA